LHGGKIEFLGRPDQQIKLRGRRIELGEIEATLERHPAVRQAAVLLQAEPGGDFRLVAYVVNRQDSSFSPAEIREFLKAHLPEYMIPAVWVKLDAMPLTPNGKIYRQGLRLRGESKLVDERFLTPPGTTVEQALVGIWADVLGKDQVGIHDDFFESGGHSILATQLIARLHETFGIEFSLRDFFQSPTVAGMAAAISKNPERQKRIERISELLISVAGYSEDEVDAMLADEVLPAQ
jgi:acyl carrier protein